MIRNKFSRIAALLVVVLAVAVPGAYAATSPNLTQVINAGTQSMDIVDGSGNPIASPAVVFTALPFAFTCQTNTATFGTATQMVGIKNDNAANVSITMAGSGSWTNGTNTYSYNDATGSGCTNGQMTISGGTFNKTAGATAPTNTLPGGAFSGATPVTLFSTSTKTAWEGNLQGFTLSQKIPAQQASGNYSLGMTLTATFI